MRGPWTLAAICAAWLPAAPAAAGDAPPALTWFSDEGHAAWSASLAPSRAAAGPSVALTVAPWFPTLPDIVLEPVGPDSERTNLRSYTGKVLILDFWASWCQPCAEAWPHLQALRDAERSRGLEVLTVNVQEHDTVARQFAGRLNLTLPIVRHSASLDEALRVDRLPTVLVVDRQGRIRVRFDGYRQGVVEKIAEIARELLAEEPLPPEHLADVVDGAHWLDARWSRVVGTALTGLAVAHGGTGAVLAASGWDLFEFGPDGTLLGRRRVGPGVERLALSQGGPSAFGYRSAGRRVTEIPLAGAAVESWESRANVLDLLVERTDEQTTLLLATVEGVERVRVGGSRIGGGDPAGVVWGLAAGPRGAIALEGEGGLRWLDAALETVRLVEVPRGSRVLVSAAGAGGVGVAPSVLEAWAAGSFDRGSVAAAAGGELIVFDLASGRERFRARWPGITALAAADLDRDGRDELFVASGKRLTALGVAGPAALAGPPGPPERIGNPVP